MNQDKKQKRKKQIPISQTSKPFANALTAPTGLRQIANSYAIHLLHGKNKTDQQQMTATQSYIEGQQLNRDQYFFQLIHHLGSPISHNHVPNPMNYDQLHPDRIVQSNLPAQKQANKTGKLTLLTNH